MITVSTWLDVPLACVCRWLAVPGGWLRCAPDARCLAPHEREPAR